MNKAKKMKKQRKRKRVMKKALATAKELGYSPENFPKKSKFVKRSN